MEAAYTLGATDSGLVRRVLIPGAAPEIAEILRMVLGWAWTYVIVAELIGAVKRHRHMITDSQALLATDQIIFGIIVIGDWTGQRSAVQAGDPQAFPLGGAGKVRRMNIPLCPGVSRTFEAYGRAPRSRCRRPISTSPRTTSSPSSGPRVAARARFCASSPGSTNSPRRGSARWRRIDGPGLTAAWCSRATPCSRG